MKILSLFDGISCGMVAFERASIKVDEYIAYEIDQNAVAISNKNYPQIARFTDVLAADFSQHKDIDIVIGGSPCTHWSIARSSTAKHDREVVASGIGWELFTAFANCIDIVKPKYFLYENNFSISSEIKAQITATLGVEPIMINSNLVSAQNRKRLYWTNIPNVTQPLDKQISLHDILECDDSVLQSYYVKQTPSRIRMWNNGDGRKGGAICCDNITHKHKSGTVTSKQDRNYNAGLLEYRDFCRYLTVTELERLQTLSDGYTDCGLSLLQRQLAIGNGWTVDVIAHIFSFLPDEYKREEAKK